MSKLLSIQIKQMGQEPELMAESYHTLQPMVLNNNITLCYLLADKRGGGGGDGLLGTCQYTCLQTTLTKFYRKPETCTKGAMHTVTLLLDD